MAIGGNACPNHWSVMKYDLKTGLDILGLPCSVRMMAQCQDTDIPDIQDFTTERNSGCDVKFEHNVCVCFVRARVVDLPDVDWFLKKKGAEFVTSHALFSGTEILIPLEYNGRVRLYHRDGGKQYYSVREVIEDFPRYVRVEKDTICASPNVSAPQIVYEGTLLELDRVTKTVQTVRGSRETYLICRDDENQRELAFQLSAPVHFTSVTDTTKSSLKEFIEHLPLPQTVEFLNVNPYDIVSCDDDDSKDLLTLLDAPLELLNLQMENFLVGRREHCDYNECDIVAVPARNDVLENTFVHVPLDSQGDCQSRYNNGDHVALADINEQIYDCLRQKLYLRLAGDDSVLVLRQNFDGLTGYEAESQPDTPPVPDKSETLLKHAVSARDIQEHLAGPGKCNKHGRRKRIFSENDVDQCSDQNRLSEGGRGLRAYLCQLSRRVKKAAFIFDTKTISNVDGWESDTDVNMSVRNKKSDQTKRKAEFKSGFICYIDKCQTQNGKTVKSCPSDVTKALLNNHSNVTFSPDDALYTSVDTIRQRKGSGIHRCSLCRQILLHEQKSHPDN